MRLAPDYVAVVDPDTFVPETSLGERGLIIAAARLGATRLIDNLPMRESAEPGAPAPAALLEWRGRSPRRASSTQQTENDTSTPSSEERRAAQEG